MRHPILLALILVLACSSGDSAITPPPAPPPPPPGGAVPSVLAIQNGDGQQGEPGAVLPVKPVVAVKDAAGLGVAGVTVSFAIDSGGGSLQSASAVTASDGTASPGDWHLGQGEGRNVVSASVASLPKLKLVATGSFAGVSVPVGTSSASGGTLTINRPGSPLDHFAITTSDGVLPANVTFSVTAASNSLVSLGGASGGSSLRTLFRAPPAMIPVTPVITIVSSGPPVAAGEVFLRIPLPPRLGNDVVVAVIDASGHPIAFLPVVLGDSNSVTVTTRGLDNAIYAQIDPATLTLPRRLSVVVFSASTGRTPLSQSYPVPYSSGFVFGKHNFEFAAMSTALTPAIDAGMVYATLGAYSIFPAGINGQLPWAANQPVSDSRGIMLSAGLAKDFSNLLGIWGPYYAWQNWYSVDHVQYTRWQVSQIIWALWAGQPVPVMLTNGTFSHTVLATAWEPNGEYLTVYDPSDLFAMHRIQFSNSEMVPYVPPNFGGIALNVMYVPTGVGYAMWPRISAGVYPIFYLPDEPYFSSWPSAGIQAWTAMQYGANRFVPDTLFMTADTNRIWTIYQPAAYSLPAGGLPVLGGWGLGYSRVLPKVGNVWTEPTGTYQSSQFIDARLATIHTQWYQQTLGVDLESIDGPDASRNFSWLGWRQVDVVKYALTIPSVTAVQGTPSSYTVTSPGGPVIAANAAYEWNFNDGQAVTRVTGAVPVSHTFTTAGTYAINLTVFHPVSGRAIAKFVGSTTVNSNGAFPVWRVTSVTIDAQPMPLTPSEQFLYGGSSDAYLGDNRFWGEIQSGARDGVLVFATKDAPLSVHRGLWMLPDPHTDFATIPAMPPIMLSLANIGSTGHSADGSAPDAKYSEGGNLPDGGGLGGVGWTSTSNFTGVPKTYMEASATFTPTTASGTITYTYRAIEGSFSPIFLHTWTTKVSFQAIRVR